MVNRPTVSDMMEAYSLDAVDHAKASLGIDLDYSAESVRKVEDILTVMFDSKPKGFLGKLLKRGPSTQDVVTFSKMYGGYIGEVLRRNGGGGEWYLDTQLVPGQTVIGLRKDDKSMPPAKVGKRLTNGPEDNVWHYFQIIFSEKW